MGGGDLNLKKSWHPNTFKNKERVWKAEQKDAMEQKRIAEFQREIQEERDRERLQKAGEESGVLPKNEDGKLDWMYQGPAGHVTREDYLLGRKVDKTFEMLVEEEQNKKPQPEPDNKPAYIVEHEIIPESVVRREKSNTQIDMRRKILEDPLYLIRQKEEATKREITANPVKMKQLQMLVSSLKKKRSDTTSSDSSSEQKKKKKSKKHKKEKKKKKKRKKRKSSSSSSSGSDTERHINKERQEISRKNKSNFEYRTKEYRDKQEKQREVSPSRQRQHREHSNDRQKSSSNNWKHRNSDENTHRSYKDTRQKSYNDSRHRSNPWGRDKERHRRHRSRSNSRENDERREAEMDEKRRQMMEAAKERDVQRIENLIKYERERVKEIQEENHAEKFLKQFGGQSVESSMSDRIKSKVGTLQKGSQHMNTNFLKRS